ncbi:MAG: hypothetical protein FWG31_00390 [Oscillospiraceae bacterium]|nr:hypothetical protein [Oscillospiraceae bacterium]
MRKRLLQIGVPAVCGVLLLLILTIAAPWKSGGKDTPVRVSEYTDASSLYRSYTLEEAILESDLVADITITSWLGETERPDSTFFKAKVNNVIAGEPLEELVVVQVGCGSSTRDDYPLFQRGDRLLLFLIDYDGPKDEKMPYDTAYWIIGSYSTVMDVVTVGKTLYAIDRWGFMTRDEENYDYDEHGNYIEVLDSRYGFSDLNQSEARTALRRRDEADPILATMNNRSNRVLLYDEVLNYAQKINKGGITE